MTPSIEPTARKVARRMVWIILGCLWVAACFLVWALVAFVFDLGNAAADAFAGFLMALTALAALAVRRGRIVSRARHHQQQ
jgi:uncharacterized membrane protein